MPRPPKVGEKKAPGWSISATPTEKESVQRRASDLGFKSVGMYFLALHEAEQRLALTAETSFNGERWFVLRDMETAQTAAATSVPEDKTLQEAIEQRYQDRVEKKSAALMALPGGAPATPKAELMANQLGGASTAGPKHDAFTKQVRSTHDKTKPVKTPVAPKLDEKRKEA